jgi:hypothetical protein
MRSVNVEEILRGIADGGGRPPFARALDHRPAVSARTAAEERAGRW